MRKIAECDDDGTLIRQIPFSSSLHCTRGIPFSGSAPQLSLRINRASGELKYKGGEEEPN